jgi:hypothetical protein
MINRLLPPAKLPMLPEAPGKLVPYSKVVKMGSKFGFLRKLLSIGSVVATAVDFGLSIYLNKKSIDNYKSEISVKYRSDNIDIITAIAIDNYLRKLINIANSNERYSLLNYGGGLTVKNYFETTVTLGSSGDAYVLDYDELNITKGENEQMARNNRRGKFKKFSDSTSDSNLSTNSYSSKKKFTGENTKRLDLSDNKITTNFSSGIPSGLLAVPIQEPKSTYSTYFSQNGYICFDGHTFPAETTYESYAEEHTRTVIYPRILDEMQSKLNYNITDRISISDVRKHFQFVGYALQIYYNIDSVLTYFDNYSSKNIAVAKLRELITPDIIDKHEQLRSRLEFTAIPKNFVTYSHFMYQFYSMATEPGSPIMRNNFGKMFLHDVVNTYTGADITRMPLGLKLYETLFKELDDRSFVSAAYRQAYPENIINSLPLSSPTSIKDDQFSTFWTNSSMVHGWPDGFTNHKYPLLESQEEEIGLYSLTNNLDGLMVASTSLAYSRNEDSEVYEMGIWRPSGDVVDDLEQALDDNRCNRQIYAFDEQSQSYGFNGPVTYNYSSQAGWSFWAGFSGSTFVSQLELPAAGSTLIDYRTIRQLRPQTQMSMDWLYGM